MRACNLAGGKPVDVLPYLTSDFEGIGGVIKQIPADFVVEELPLYEPCGNGTHVYFGIEKQEMTTYAAVSQIAKKLGRSPRDIGYAGLKDANAVTRQTFSLEHEDPERILQLELPHIRILWINRHTNKIKLGHLRGNRFEIKIRDAASDAHDCADAILKILNRRGVPNYFGEQRFGTGGTNALVGRAILCGEFESAVRLIVGEPTPKDREDVAQARRLFADGDYARAAQTWPHFFRDHRRLCQTLVQSKGNFQKAWWAVNPDLRRLYLSALQSDLFNHVVAARIQSLNRVMVGDMAYKHVNGACFRVENVEAEQPRCDAFEISPTGPIFGSRMTPTTDEPGHIESQVLSDSGLTLDHFGRPDGAKLKGERRPLRIPLLDVRFHDATDHRGAYGLIEFSLPSGCYATSVLREIMKNDRRTDSP